MIPWLIHLTNFETLLLVQCPLFSIHRARAVVSRVHDSGISPRADFARIFASHYRVYIFRAGPSWPQIRPPLLSFTRRLSKQGFLFIYRFPERSFNEPL